MMAEEGRVIDRGSCVAQLFAHGGGDDDSLLRIFASSQMSF